MFSIDLAYDLDINLFLLIDFIYGMTGIMVNIISLKEYTHDEETE